ncbi:hypothetical protein A0O36_00023 [Piscirickettsiaceae bacterium NZ-RLO1]|nr:hypothetical protein A0O36_00023 [Piscirickettsiaceae bacterium NZ-RLO1]
MLGLKGQAGQSRSLGLYPCGKKTCYQADLDNRHIEFTVPEIYLANSPKNFTVTNIHFFDISDYLPLVSGQLDKKRLKNNKQIPGIVVKNSGGTGTYQFRSYIMLVANSDIHFGENLVNKAIYDELKYDFSQRKIKKVTILEKGRNQSSKLCSIDYMKISRKFADTRDYMFETESVCPIVATSYSLKIASIGRENSHIKMNNLFNKALQGESVIRQSIQVINK